MATPADSESDAANLKMADYGPAGRTSRTIDVHPNFDFQKIFQAEPLAGSDFR
jgi:hypothetical protein